MCIRDRFFVVPILIYQNRSPVESIQESVRIVRSKWGEAFVGVTATSLIFFGLGMLGILPIMLGAAVGQVGLLVGAAIAVVYWILLAAANSAVRGILVGALYHYHEHGTMPAGFEAARPAALKA